MSAAAPPTAPPSRPTPPPLEGCPLCGGPLDPAQDWCLRCGAAARTRLAAPPRWRGPILSLLAVGAISLGVLAAALVKLAADDGPAPAAITHTVTTTASSPAAATGATGSTLTSTGSTTTGAAGTTTSTTGSTTATTTGAAGVKRSRLGGLLIPKAKGKGTHSPKALLEQRLRELQRRSQATSQEASRG